MTEQNEITLTELMALIKTGKKNAITFRQAQEILNTTEEDLQHVIALARQQHDPIVYHRGKIWRAETPAEVELIFKSERGQKIYR